MKKFSFLTGLWGMAAIISLAMVSCQKEQAATTEKAAASESTNIVGVAGNNDLFGGSIQPTYAAALAANYAKKYSDANQAQYVAFNAKDLIAFINNLQSKYKSDVIYVNFGVYGKDALPVSVKDYGRLTVFFTGNKIPAPSAGYQTNDAATSDAYMNHGEIFPPTN